MLYFPSNINTCEFILAEKTGILLINLGTPDNCDPKSVRRYLREFLSDPYVIDLPFLVRFILLNLIILPTRPKQSAKAYQEIWTEEGSPLLLHSVALKNKLQAKVGDAYKVALGMRYGNPSIADALEELENINNIIVLPLYPQYSKATTESSIQKVKQVLKQRKQQAKLHIIKDFYKESAFIDAQVELIKQAQLPQDHFILFSYHGLPERQLIKDGCNPICQGACQYDNNFPQSCYRKQCYKTTEEIAQKLQLKSSQYTTAFQSRLGKTPWIQPYTDQSLEVLSKQGIKNLCVVCPSFTADCLETLEEIGLQAKEQWLSLGGQSFSLIPCVNSSETWVNGLQSMLTEQLFQESSCMF